MNYWIDLFTGTTWEEFRADGARITGFSPRMKRAASRVKAGDIFLCYLTGVMHWVGALEVKAPSTDRRRIWRDAEFPVRFEVQPIVLLDPQFGIPMEDLRGLVGFFQNAKDAGKFKGFVRMSPNQFKNTSDGSLILKLLREAEKNPTERVIDPKKLARRPIFRITQKKGKKKSSTIVSIPEADDLPRTIQDMESNQPLETSHTEIQFELLKLGADLGLDVWVARNDKSKVVGNVPLGSMARVVDSLPTQFNDATNRTIELIDVLWLRGNSIVAAFEVESTTSVYSGLLRMSDLLALQPNLDINLFLVAPDERKAKVEQEILRPTFNLRENPLAEVCGFLSFSKLTTTIAAVRDLGLTSALRADFLKKTAQYFNHKSSE